jgi:transglutaminase-like putative cysteine protease
MDAIFNGDNPLVMRQLALVAGGDSLLERLERWYIFVRDAIRYDPFSIHLEPAQNAASRTLENQRGHCVHKSILLVAGFRAMGVPARLGLARVRNHLAAEKLQEKLGTDVLTPHGYAAFWNGSRWVKCTPVFNKTLCEKLGTTPLAWSAEEDVLFQPLSGGGDAFMEYLEDYGLHSSVPLTFIRNQLQECYPQAFDANGRWALEDVE